MLALPMLLLQVSFFVLIAHYRFIDGDEGAFLLASRLVLLHKTPYLDFFYQQAPLLPYVYGMWMKAVGISWNSGRMLCVVLTTLLGMLLYRHICHLTRSWLAGVSAVVLFASSTLVFAWFSVVKTHCLAGLLLFGAYLVVSRTSATSRRWMLLAGGLLLGLSVDTRSYVLLLVPLFLWWIFQNTAPGFRARSILMFLGGFVIGTSPSLYLFLSSPDLFLFNNLRYHAIRSSSGLVGGWEEKLVTLITLFLGSPEANGLQWSMLFFVSVGLVGAMPRREYPPRLAFYLAVILGVICLLPTPSYIQYFSLCVPFLIVTAVCAISDYLRHLESGRLAASAACVVAMLAYLAAGAYDCRKYLVTGDGVPGVHVALDRDDWRLQRVVEVSQAIDQIARPGEIVASFWSGDIFQAKVNSLPGMESPFALRASERLDPQQRERYHILSLPEIESDLAAHRPRIVVLRNEISSAFSQEELPRARQLAYSLESLLQTDGYTRVRSIGGISIYVCCANNTKS